MKMEAEEAIRPLKNAVAIEKDEQVKSVMNVAIKVLEQD